MHVGKSLHTHVYMCAHICMCPLVGACVHACMCAHMSPGVLTTPVSQEGPYQGQPLLLCCWLGAKWRLQRWACSWGQPGEPEPLFPGISGEQFRPGLCFSFLQQDPIRTKFWVGTGLHFSLLGLMASGSSLPNPEHWGEVSALPLSSLTPLSSPAYFNRIYA